jgi:cytosine/adenosine deaminase-related metal-dependent hydrolase
MFVNNMLLRRIAYLVTQDDDRRILTDVDVLIEGDRIVTIGKRLPAQDEEIDCHERIVMPG